MIRGLLYTSVKYVAAAISLALITGSFADTASAYRYRVQRFAAEDQPAAPPVLAARPMIAVVSIRDQRVTFYDAKGNTIRSGVSSGQASLDTPVGIYSVLEKDIDHRSNIYDDAQMPFMQRITWTGIALHAGVLPGYPASHGCVRLAYDFAQKMFPLTRIGMRVVIARDDVAPMPIADPFLFKPTPAGEPKVTSTAYETSNDFDDGSSTHASKAFVPDLKNYPAREAEFEELKSVATAKELAAKETVPRSKELKKIVDQKAFEKARAANVLKSFEAVKKAADDRVERADKLMLAAKGPDAFKKAEEAKAKTIAGNKDAYAKYDTTKAKYDDADKAWAAASDAFKSYEAGRSKIVTDAQDAKRKTLPASVFISLKTKRLYLRQGYEPVLDVPVAIANPEQSIGTHIFTAMDYTNNSASDLRWNVVSIGTRKGDDDGYGYDRKKSRANAPAEPTDVAAAKAALARITMPPEVAQRVAMAAWPGSSLIVSDEALHRETGKGTDFIVTISSEPQGGLRRTRRQYPKVYRDEYWGDSYGYGSSYGNGRKGRYQPNAGFFNFW